MLKNSFSKSYLLFISFSHIIRNLKIGDELRLALRVLGRSAEGLHRFDEADHQSFLDAKLLDKVSHLSRSLLSNCAD